MQEENRIELLKQAMESVLTTLTANDYFNIVLFSTDAQFIDSQVNFLIPGTIENIARMKKLVRDLKPLGSTNMLAAFKLGFQAFVNINPNPETPFSSNCKKAAIFLTDGKANGDQSVDSVKQEAAKLQGAGVTLFTYTLGNDADHQTAKDIACASGGLWSAVGYGGNLRSQMTNFYQFFEILKAQGESKVVWAEPYTDANGLGKVTTAALSVYDNSRNPPVLIGVLGMDVTLQDLSKLEPNYNQLLQFLVKRSNYCPKEAQIGSQERICLLERLRDKQASTAFGSISGVPSGLCFPASQCSSNTTLLSTRQNSCRAVGQVAYPQLLKEDRQSQMCGDICKPPINPLGIGLIAAGALVVIGAIVVLWCWAVRRKRNQKLSYAAQNTPASFGNVGYQLPNQQFQPQSRNNVVQAQMSYPQNPGVGSSMRNSDTYDSMFGSSQNSTMDLAFGQGSCMEAAPAYTAQPGAFERKL